MPKLVINYGTAGSRKIKKKRLVDCTKFIQRDMDVTGLGFMRGETPFEQDPPFVIQQQNVEFNPIGRNATCGSGDNWAEDKSQYYDWEANLADGIVVFKEKVLSEIKE